MECKGGRSLHVVINTKKEKLTNTKTSYL